MLDIEHFQIATVTAGNDFLTSLSTTADRGSLRPPVPRVADRPNCSL